MKLEVSGRIPEKSPKIKFYVNPSSGNRVVPCGQPDKRTDRQTDRHDEANSPLFSILQRRLKRNIFRCVATVV